MFGIIQFTAGILWTLSLGFMLHKEWGWFITPAFHFAAPSFTQCVGIILVASTLKYDFGETLGMAMKVWKDDNSSDDSALKSFLSLLCVALIWISFFVSYVYYRAL